MKESLPIAKGATLHNYSVGDKVWLEGINITTTRPSKKLGDKRYGPSSLKRKKDVQPIASPFLLLGKRSTHIQ